MVTSRWRAGVDIGGTFTDLMLVDEDSGRFRVGKVLTTASEPAAAVRGALLSLGRDEETAPPVEQRNGTRYRIILQS